MITLKKIALNITLLGFLLGGAFALPLLMKLVGTERMWPMTIGLPGTPVQVLSGWGASILGKAGECLKWVSIPSQKF